MKNDWDRLQRLWPAAMSTHIFHLINAYTLNIEESVKISRQTPSNNKCCVWTFTMSTICWHHMTLLRNNERPLGDFFAVGILTCLHVLCHDESFSFGIQPYGPLYMSICRSTNACSHFFQDKKFKSFAKYESCYMYPADTWRNNDVIITSKRRCYVVLT